MGLRDIQIPTASVVVGDQTFEVRGIAFADLGSLFNTYGPTLSAAFAKIQSTASVDMDMAVLARDLLGEFPQLGAATIAYAADDATEAGVNFAGKLPFATQVEALQEIAKLTFRSEADVEKLAESLKWVADWISGAMSPKLVSLSGIGASDDS